jgi:cytochrome c oxidase cbb3-type subunit I/II
MEDPRSTTPQSIMPSYPWLMSDDVDFGGVQARVDAMAMLGVPYGAAVQRGEAMAREQAAQVAAEIAAQGGPADLEQKKIVALIAYLQRLGTDIRKPAGNQGSSKQPVADRAPAPSAPKGI